MTDIIYEQPLNEHIRACLRLEHLFNSLTHHIHGPSEWDHRAVVNGLIQLGSLLDRADLRSKLAKEVGRQFEALAPHRGDPCVEQEGLNALLDQLQDLQKKLYAQEGRFGQAIRENEFLNGIRQYLYNPGGACSFDLPLYYDWLHTHPERRQRDLERWLGEFDVLRMTLELLLQLLRDSAEPQTKRASAGFFQDPLDPRVPCTLIRVILPPDSGVFPEISSGRHRVSIRFNQSRDEGRPIQVDHDVDFQLVYCVG